MSDFLTTNNLKATGAALLMTVAITLALAWLLFFARLTSNPFVFPAAVAIAIASTALAMRGSIRVVTLILSTLGIIFLALVVSAFFWDNSYDGNTYHQASIIWLADGWNPAYEFCPADNIWSRHYAKGLEIIAAQIFKSVSSVGFCSPIYALESSKAVNFILYAATLLIVISTVKEQVASISRRNLVGVAIVTAANPVVVTQLFTFYNDYALYCLAAILLAAFFGIKRGDKMSAVIAACATILAVNTKFTHFFYIGVEWALFLIFLALKKQFKATAKWAVAALAMAAVSALAFGYNPYVTNTLSEGNPFYPLLGSDIDIMTNNTPEIYADGGRIGNFVKSQFTAPNDEAWSAFPLPTSKNALTGIGYDERSMGFGPLFPWILLAALLMLLFGKTPRTVWLIVIATTGATFVFEQAWWARYVAFAWLIPVMAAISANAYARRGIVVRLKAVIYALALIGAAGPVTISAVKASATRQYESRLFAAASNSSQLRADFAGFESFGKKLKLLGINYEETAAANLDLNRSVFLFGKNDGNIYPTIELDAEGFDWLSAQCSGSRIIEFERRCPINAEQ